MCLLAVLLTLLGAPAGAVRATQREQAEAATHYLVKSDRNLGGPFKNVLLLIHCRKATLICKERWKQGLYEPYLDFFGAVTIGFKENGCEKESSFCVAKMMEKYPEYDGAFYMHFDAIIDPCKLAPIFDKNKMGWFVEPADHEIADNMKLLQSSVQDDTLRGPVEWTNQTAKAFFLAMGQVQEALKSDLYDFDLKTVHLFKSENDLFYVPKRALESYHTLTKTFSENEVWHEISGPTMRKVLEKNLKLGGVNFQCKGANLANLKDTDILQDDFRCGHRFDMREPTVISAMKTTLTKCKESRVLDAQSL